MKNYILNVKSFYQKREASNQIMDGLKKVVLLILNKIAGKNKVTFTDHGRERSVSFYYILPVVFCSVMLISSCLKPVNIDDSDNVFPLTLRLVNNQQSIHLAWDAFSGSGFRKYIVIRSASPIVSGQTPRNGGGLTILSEITNSNQNFYYDHLVATSPIWFYKVYIDIGNRFIESQNLEVKNTLLIFETTLAGSNTFDYSHQNAALIPHTSIADRTLSLFDKSTRNIIKSAENSPIHFNSIIALPNLYYTDKNGNSFFYFVYSGQLAQLDLEYLSVKTLSSIPNVTLKTAYSLAADETFLVYTLRDANEGTLVISRETGQILQKLFIEKGLEKRLLLAMNAGKHEFAEISKNSIEVFTLSDSGEKSIIQKMNLNIVSDLLDGVVTSPDGKHIIFNKGGTLYDNSFKIVKENTCTDCAGFFFSHDSKHIYSLHKTSNTSTTVRKYSVPDYALKETLNLNSMVVKVVPTPSGIGIFGNFSSATGISFYKEITL